jgi:signal transduction histidine kinase
VTVRADGGTAGREWRIQVVDNGHGMSPEVRENVFQPLYTTKVKGTGLGLAIVANMVAGHGGAISVESDVGKGTTFTIILPHQAAHWADPAEAPAPAGE